MRGRQKSAGCLSSPGPFQSTPPCGGDRAIRKRGPRQGIFQSTPPCGGDPTGILVNAETGEISIHAPLRGRLSLLLFSSSFCKFQSTPPCGGDVQLPARPTRVPHFNPRPLAGATDVTCTYRVIGVFQSTPPCGGDAAARGADHQRPDFNPRPLAGATPAFRNTLAARLFQSTPPCGGDG